MTRSLGDALAAMLGEQSAAEDADGTAAAPDGTAGEVAGVLRRVLGEDAFADPGTDPPDADAAGDDADAAGAAPAMAWPPAPEARLVDDLGMDSLAVVEFVVRVEEATGVRIEDADAAGFRTLGDIVDYVEARRGEPGAG
ncbi:hypothetical protein CSPHI_08285 [Corynebacterium sphenisci DSM 44792]|uniref:Carrier domain-containing protein n=1 Tax=Corynebacterium sphenisci DSM 44792 TaxID=1437874 RepID=A0A1L7CYY0_9CORY|nr:acyl carrier protein [Corynebacterium sphenisci]APT91032.1 hypothetical protein CSPHI_08285 [Corynebacterium sphenisci DSM 44792]